jgi:hypothetical protein
MDLLHPTFLSETWPSQQSHFQLLHDFLTLWLSFRLKGRSIIVLPVRFRRNNVHVRIGRW